MTPRSLFLIVLKILGLFFLKNVIETIPQLISTISYLTQPNNFDSGIFFLIGTTLLFWYYIFLTYHLLFNADKILDKLNLDKGFSEEIFAFNITDSSILTTALIIIGGLILAEEIPNLCKALYQYIQHKTIERHTGNKVDFSYCIFAGVKIILGLLLLGERKRIVNFIEERQKK